MAVTSTAMVVTSPAVSPVSVQTVAHMVLVQPPATNAKDAPSKVGSSASGRALLIYLCHCFLGARAFAAALDDKLDADELGPPQRQHRR